MLTNRLNILLGLYLLSCLFYLTIGVKGNWDFILWFRSSKLISMTLVAISISVATILFQTICQNRILTPSIMGFDALYILVQTVLVFVVGSFSFSAISAETNFLINFLIMMICATALFGTLLGKAKPDVFRLILTGIIFGVLFNAITNFLQRLIDPSEFSVVMNVSFAQFNRINSPALIMVCTGFVLVSLIVTWRLRHHLDVLALGRNTAINLGISYQKLLILVLIIIAALVSTSTALVGPVTFFGLLVSNLTYMLFPSHRHSLLLPAVVLVSAIVLIGGQTILERMLNLTTPLSVIIEFLGGITFLAIILKGAKR